MQDMDDTNREFDAVIHDRMRIFLGTKEFHNLSNWFENQSTYISEGITQDIISREDLISLSRMTEFQQLFFEASIKLSDVLHTIKILIDQNKNLISTIERELIK
jgi:hypothetical protein